MSSQTAEVCDAIAAEITAATWAEVVTVERSYLHQFSEDSADTMQATVAPAALAGGLASRGLKERDERIVITLSKRLADTTIASVDTCVETVEGIRDSYGGAGPRKIVGATTAVAMAAEADPLYDPALLYEQNLFASVIVVTVQDYR